MGANGIYIAGLAGHAVIRFVYRCLRSNDQIHLRAVLIIGLNGCGRIIKAVNAQILRILFHHRTGRNGGQRIHHGAEHGGIVFKFAGIRRHLIVESGAAVFVGRLTDLHIQRFGCIGIGGILIDLPFCWHYGKACQRVVITVDHIDSFLRSALFAGSRTDFRLGI